MLFLRQDPNPTFHLQFMKGLSPFFLPEQYAQDKIDLLAPSGMALCDLLVTLYSPPLFALPYFNYRTVSLSTFTRKALDTFNTGYIIFEENAHTFLESSSIKVT